MICKVLYNRHICIYVLARLGLFVGGGRSRSDKSQAALGGNAGSTVRVGVRRVAGKAGALSRSRGDEREGAVGRHAFDAFRGVCWVASKVLRGALERAGSDEAKCGEESNG